MKSSRTPQCKICMVERKEILHRLKESKSKVINDNSDIYSSCKCGSRFHKFTSRTITPTLRTRLTQKKVPSARKSKQLRTRRNKKRTSNMNLFASPRQISTPRRPLTPESTFQTPTPRLIDTNVPGLPYRSPSYYPTNLEIAQFQQYQTMLRDSAVEV